jgi:hypothetical protein
MPGLGLPCLCMLLLKAIWDAHVSPLGIPDASCILWTPRLCSACCAWSCQLACCGCFVLDVGLVS